MHLLQRAPPVRFSAETRRGCWWQSMVENRLSVKTRLCFIYLFSFWQSMINKQTLTQHDIAGSLFPRSSFGCLYFFVMNEVRQSMTEIQSKQMALCLNPLPNISSHQWVPQALRGLWIWDVIISNYFRATSSSASFPHQTVPNIYYQPSVSNL